jgi:hypothetical protein
MEASDKDASGKALSSLVMRVAEGTVLQKYCNHIQCLLVFQAVVQMP